MTTRLDSRQLFLAQVGNHSQELSDLLVLDTTAPIAAAQVERAILCTNMLASSASLMYLEDWSEFLGSLSTLFAVYRDKQMHWDERIAQLTSEVIEKEEDLVSAAEQDASLDLSDIIPAEIIKAMLFELNEIVLAAQALPEAQPTPTPQQESAPTMEAQQPGGVAAPEKPAEADRPTAPVSTRPIDTERPLGNGVAELRRTVDNLIDAWTSSGADLQNSADGLTRIRQDLCLIDFYAQTMERFIESRMTPVMAPFVDSMEPIRLAIEDYTKVLCVGTNRRVDVKFVAKESALDARLLMPTQRILQYMIGDVFARCNDEYLRVDITIEYERGSLHWTLRDNGNNFITDSRLDPDELLAFYPHLRETSRILAEHNGLLWVEPDENRDARFAFALPTSYSPEPYVVWGEDNERFAVRSSQVCDVSVLDPSQVENDERGEFLTQSGKRVPLIQLSQVYTDAPDGTERIAVIGHLEKRIAFYVDDEGKAVLGSWMRDALPAWRNMNEGVVHIGDVKVPLVDAERLIGRYRAIVDAGVEEEISGGVVTDETDLSQTQASIEKDSVPPPDTTPPAETATNILVFERSEALRNSLASILSKAELTAKTVDRLEAALEYLGQAKPSLVISEFRSPSMGAKVLAERLREEGREIPILVTTSHRGESAELLASRLGVAGYITKPLNASEVLERVQSFLGDRASVRTRPVGNV